MADDGRNVLVRVLIDQNNFPLNKEGEIEKPITFGRGTVVFATPGEGKRVAGVLKSLNPDITVVEGIESWAAIGEGLLKIDDPVMDMILAGHGSSGGGIRATFDSPDPKNPIPDVLIDSTTIPKDVADIIKEKVNGRICLLACSQGSSGILCKVADLAQKTGKEILVSTHRLLFNMRTKPGEETHDPIWGPVMDDATEIPGEILLVYPPPGPKK